MRGNAVAPNLGNWFQPVPIVDAYGFKRVEKLFVFNARTTVFMVYGTLYIDTVKKGAFARGRPLC